MRKYCCTADVRECSTVDLSRAWVWTPWGLMIYRFFGKHTVGLLYLWVLHLQTQPTMNSKLHIHSAVDWIHGWLNPQRQNCRQGGPTMGFKHPQILIFVAGPGTKPHWYQWWRYSVIVSHVSFLCQSLWKAVPGTWASMQGFYLGSDARKPVWGR